MASSRVLFVFLDGVGVGNDDPSINPLSAADAPELLEILEGRKAVSESVPFVGARAAAMALDATLGIPGLPQSGTGQIALLTGLNAAERFGRHFGPYAPTTLRSLVEQESLLARTARAGRRVAFANGYPAGLIAMAADSGRRPLPLRAAITIAALGAGVLNRDEADIISGNAVASEITHDSWRKFATRPDIPAIAPVQAGRNLARIANSHDLTLFAHYATDSAGHLKDLTAGVAAWRLVDEFIGGVVSDLDDDLLLIIASDHGNLEDARTQHTLNPALCIVVGPGHQKLAGRLRALTDVTPELLGLLTTRGCRPA
ncbi:MAG TPA: alkaline phosphatase family protein [Gemmatimonadaceae bacterium]|nr:alkaline phosphatase family protein [Gemmatimonadaceae bacterium]